MLLDKEKEEILSNFPNIKLSYEKISHNKVYNYNIASFYRIMYHSYLIQFND